MEVNGKKLKAEIEKRTRDTSKLIEIETKKLAVGEMVLERLETILDLLNAAGFKIVKVTTQQPAAPPANTVVVQAPVAAPPAAVKNPCVLCGQEAAFAEDFPDGSKKYYCRPHAQQRSREKQEEAASDALFKGQTYTNFQRPRPTGPPPQKTIIQAPPAPAPPSAGQSAADLLKGPFNGPLEPPHNPVLDE